MKKLIIMLVSVLLIVAGCQLSSKGSIAVTIGETISAKTFLPDFDTAIAQYHLIGEGPDGEGFDLTAKPGEEVFIDNLEFGLWKVTVYALNADGVIIGEGQDSAQVNTGETAKLDILVRPLVGTGALDLEVNWPGEDTQTPSIRSAIIPAIGSDVLYPEFTINGGNQGTYLNPAIDTGYHTVIVQLYDNTVLTAGAVEVARIIKDQTTYGVFTFEEINEFGGAILINIRPEPSDPIDLSILGGDDLIFPGDAPLLTADAPDETGNLVYVWYVNGEPVKTGSSIDDPTYLFADYPVGVYRVDVTAFTADGKRGGSATKTIEVIDQGIVSGQVGTYLDGKFLPLEGVRVAYGDEAVLTDRLGRFRLWDLEIFIDIHITLDFSFKGYLTNFKPVDYIIGKENDIGRIALLPAKELVYPSSEAVILESPSGTTRLGLPANSYEYENGKPYEGRVVARYSGLTPLEPGFNEAFVGDFLGVTLDGSVERLESFGFGGVDLFADDGVTRLQLAKDTPVDFEARVNPDSNVPPDPIPIWSFDEGRGLWVENEARAVLGEDNQGLLLTALRIRITIRIRIRINIDIVIRF
jgi:hypothetical protein